VFCRNCGNELADKTDICMSCGARPLTGKKHCQNCGCETDPLAVVCVRCAVMLGRAGVAAEDISPRSRLATTLFAFFLGVFGAHRFYTGKTSTAIVMLVLGIVGVLSAIVIVGVFLLIGVWVWAMVDFILAVSGNARDVEGKRIIIW
jgi:TM2 domain-containing membrane protein YozV